MRKLLLTTLGVILLTSISFGLRDVTCYEIVEPSEDYVQDGLSINPVVGVANLGEQAEDNVPVIFRVIKLDDGSTHYEDTVIVDFDPYPDSIEVEFPPWTPEAKCNEDEPWVDYDCYGITELDVDENPENDTAYHMTTCLWEHDVGVFDIDAAFINEIWYPGMEFCFTAHVENYGFLTEHNIPVRCEVIDKTAEPDTLVYENVQSLELINSRSSQDGSPYTNTITFPRWIVPNWNWFVVECRTELEVDQCPENDIESRRSQATFERNIEDEPSILISSSLNTLSVTLPTAQKVSLSVYDVNGCRVQTLVNDVFPAGDHEISWDAGHISSGIYFINFKAGSYREVKRIVITK